MKTLYILILVFVGSSVSIAQKSEFVDTKKVRLYNSSATILLAGENLRRTKVISQNSYYEYDCYRDMKVFVGKHKFIKTVWQLEASGKNCGHIIIISEEDLL